MAERNPGAFSSMTGFGAGEALVAGGRIKVEIRSVNHRWLDVAVKGPREYAALEPRILEVVRGRLRRGKVDVFLTRDVDRGASASVTANLPLARGFRDALEALRRELQLPGDVTLEMIAVQRDVLLSSASDPDPETEWPSVEKALGLALDSILAMRGREGARLATDLRGLSTELARLAARAAERAPKVAVEHRARMDERLRKLLADTTIDPARLDQEIAILADRADVHEELVRLGSHLGELDSILAAGGEAGRKLDFLLQEIGRETNTIGSKANDSDLAKIVVELKTAAERVREQVQNLE